MLHELPDTIELNLRTRHFEGTVFQGNNCAIGKAIKEMYPDVDGDIYVGASILDEVLYLMYPRYNLYKFNRDQAAAINQSPDTIIRTITLKKQN